MRKLLLLIGAFIMVFNSYSQTQDTICFYFTGKEVYEFDYQMDTILSWEEQTTKFYEIEVPQNQVLQ